jgi:CheY-like chemotaxis protein
MSSPDPPAPQPEVPPRPQAASVPRLLLVDDDLINQKVMLNLLKRKGWEAVAASSGRKCLEMLNRERFDLVLLDIQMPELDGYQTAELIRKQECDPAWARPAGVLPRVPIVALTTMSQPGTREKCLSCGMDEHLTKPVNTADLYATIVRILHLPA